MVRLTDKHARTQAGRQAEEKEEEEEDFAKHFLEEHRMTTDFVFFVFFCVQT